MNAASHYETTRMKSPTFHLLNKEPTGTTITHSRFRLCANPCFAPPHIRKVHVMYISLSVQFHRGLGWCLCAACLSAVWTRKLDACLNPPNLCTLYFNIANTVLHSVYTYCFSLFLVVQSNITSSSAIACCLHYLYLCWCGSLV